MESWEVRRTDQHRLNRLSHRCLYFLLLSAICCYYSGFHELECSYLRCYSFFCRGLVFYSGKEAVCWSHSICSSRAVTVKQVRNLFRPNKIAPESQGSRSGLGPTLRPRRLYPTMPRVVTPVPPVSITDISLTARAPDANRWLPRSVCDADHSVSITQHKRRPLL